MGATAAPLENGDVPPRRARADARARTFQAGQRHRQGRIAPDPDRAQLADALVGMGEMVDLVQRKRGLSQQEDGAGQGDAPSRFNSIWSQRLGKHRSEWHSVAWAVGSIVIL